MTWIITYTSPRQPNRQLFTPWVCPSSMDSTAALWSFQRQNSTATVLSITAAPQGVGA